MATKTKLILDAVDKTKAAFQSANRNIAGLEKSVGLATRAFGVLLGAGALGGVVASVARAGVAMDTFERSLKVATGSAESARKELDFVIATSKTLGLSLEETAGSYAKLSAASRGTALQGRDTREIFLAISEASTVLGLSAEQTGGALTAIEQIISKGKVSAEELRGQLGERLPGAFQIAARAIGKTTAELDDMLKAGKLTAEELLPELARELRETFGPEVSEAADSAQASFERLSTSLFELKVSIADSGLLDALAALADKVSETIAPTLEQDIARVRRRIEELKQSFRESGGIGEPTDALRELREELLRLLAIQSRALNQVDRLNPTKAILSIAATDAALTEFLKQQEEKLAKLAESFGREFETAEQEVARRLQSFSLVEHLFPEEERERIKAAIRETLYDGLEEIEIKVKKRLPTQAREGFEEISEYSKQAARNMQDAFADFLFDPFADGVEGMVKGFLDATRRMLANKMAAELFSTFFPKDDGLSLIPMNLLPERRASGGPVSSGEPYLVGEQGPELFLPQASGNILPNNKLGGGIVVNQNYSIEAGADWETLSKVLPPMFEENRRSTIGELRQLQMDGRF